MSLSTFIAALNSQGGVSLSNNYDVDFIVPDALSTWLNNYGIVFSNSTITLGDNAGGTVQSGSLIKMLCDEAQLPNAQAATGQITGRFLGEGQVNYAHTKLYTDFQLGWMCDANMTPLKFLNAWYSFIFKDYDESGNEIKPTELSGDTLTSLKGKSTSYDESRSVRLSYPSDYMAKVVITKTERSSSAPNGRAPISYTLLNVFPYTVDAVPLSYGASQITKVTSNFYYSKHIVTYNDIKSVK